jgi:hypothetical protein
MDPNRENKFVPNTSALDKEQSREVEQQILSAMKGVRYGSVEIIIHDSQVVQIERKEKIRLEKGSVREAESHQSRK